MTFDPFGDFATQGYLRNLAKEKEPDIVRRLEHTSFVTGIDGSDEQNEVAGKTSAPPLKARYEQQEMKRRRN